VKVLRIVELVQIRPLHQLLVNMKLDTLPLPKKLSS
jgi:hypothetical protein